MNDGFWTGTVGGVVFGTLPPPEILRLEAISFAHNARVLIIPDHCFQDGRYWRHLPALPGIREAFSIF